jgi:hypothetical protein
MSLRNWPASVGAPALAGYELSPGSSVLIARPPCFSDALRSVSPRAGQGESCQSLPGLT